MFNNNLVQSGYYCVSSNNSRSVNDVNVHVYPSENISFYRHLSSDSFLLQWWLLCAAPVSVIHIFSPTPAFLHFSPLYDCHSYLHNTWSDAEWATKDRWINYKSTQRKTYFYIILLYYGWDIVNLVAIHNDNN